MIHWRRKDFGTPPSILQTENCYKQIAIAVKNKNGNKYTTHYYRDKTVLDKLFAYSIDKDVFDKSKYEPKCFYCESFVETVSALQVEHYRPKAKICDESNNEVPNSNGYYWLGCEWSNLLLSCPKCNGSGAKGNRFPIKGIRRLDENPIKGSVAKPIFTRNNCLADRSPLIDEDPLLLNPEIDEIINRFVFTKYGKIEGTDDRGKISVEIYGLDRNTLNIARKRIKDQMVKLINVVINNCERGYIKEIDLKGAFIGPCEEILECNKPTKPYTLWAKYFNEHFERIFVKEVPKKYQEPLREAYISVLRDHSRTI